MILLLAGSLFVIAPIMSGPSYVMRLGFSHFKLGNRHVGEERISCLLELYVVRVYLCSVPLPHLSWVGL